MYLTWLADVARTTGYPVVEIDGWQTRGKDTMDPWGLVWHHTAGPSSGDMPTLGILINGRSDLPGPLCHYGLGRSGTIYVVAAGKANHAGAGQWQGDVFIDHSSNVIGIEAEHTGQPSDPWPAVQLDAYRKLSAAILTKISRPVANLCGHKEWAQPPESTPNRKPDPIGLDMDEQRELVEVLMSGELTEINQRVGVDDWNQAPWAWAQALGIVTEFTNPDSVVTAEELVTFLDRYHRKVVAPNLTGASGMTQAQVDKFNTHKHSQGTSNTPRDVDKI